MKKIMMVILTCLVAQTAWASWVVTYKDVESGERSQDFSDDSGRFNSGEMIYTGRHFIVVDQGSRAYWKGTPDQYCNALKVQFRKIKAQMASLPAQYRPKPISQKKVTRKKIGTKTIAGFSATGYEFFVDGIQSGRVWVSSDSGLSDYINYQKSMEKKMEKHVRCLKDMPGQNNGLENSALYKKTVKNVFILEESYRQVVSIEKKGIPSGKFEAPAGYKSFSDYQQFIDYISNNSRSSSRATSRPATAPPSFEIPERSRKEARPENRGQDRGREEDNVIEKDARDIGRGAVDEAHESTKRGIQEGISEDIQEGVGKLLDKWGF